ncbi:MAG: glycoside hydrolase family 9 protein, partial [bacterium]
GDVTLLPGVPYAVGLRSQGSGSMIMMFDPKDRSNERVQIPIHVDSDKALYSHLFIDPEIGDKAGEFALHLVLDAGDITVRELHITPPPSLAPNDGFEERLNARQGVTVDEELRGHFSTVAPSWSTRSGNLKAALRKGEGREGSTGLSIEGGAGFLELSSSQIVVDRPLGRVVLGAWVHAAEEADVEVALYEHPSHIEKTQKKIRGWEYIHLPIDSIKPGTERLSIRIRVSKEGDTPVVVDDVRLMPLKPLAPEVAVYVNQVGYGPGLPGRFIVATTHKGAENVQYILRSKRAGKQAAKGALTCNGRVYEGRVDDWGWFYWPGELPRNVRSGEYVIEAVLDGVRGISEPFVVRKSVLEESTCRQSVDFFWYQRCGMEIPGFHKACHLDDAKLPDGTHVEGWGGWHDAGDYNKYLGGGAYTGLAAFSLAYAAHEASALFDRYDRDGDGVSDALDEAMWGADFMRRMMEPESGGMRHSITTGYTFFGAPSLETDGWIGNDDDRPVQAGVSYQHFAIATWAILSMKIPDQREDYLEAARKHWGFAKAHGAGGPQFAIDALYLHEATNDAEVFAELKRQIQAILGQQILKGPWHGGLGNPETGAPSTDLVNMGMSPAALALFALKHPEDPLAEQARPALRNYLDFCEAVSDNPFNITRLVGGADPFYFSPRGGWAVGNDSQYLSQAWAACLAHRLVPNTRWISYAKAQFDWVLGLNPLNVCLMEGVGSVNLPAYHHRYFMIKNNPRGAVPGAVVNGIVARDLYHDSPHVDWDPFPLAEYECNEPWLPHNAYYVLALCAWGNSDQ